VPGSPFLVASVVVDAVSRPSPSFVRVELAGDDLADFGTAGPVYDQRIKLVLPSASGTLPDLAGAASWWDAWRRLPEHERGHMRTYSIRDLVGEGADRRLVIDLVLHLGVDASGPASRWAASAATGDRLLVIGPRRSAAGGAGAGGIEFDPGDAERLLLVGDETALPAIARILSDLPDDARGHAFLEVPHARDVAEVAAPAGVALSWLPRDGAPVGARLVPHVVEHLGGRTRDGCAEPESEGDIWETPDRSAGGGPATGGGIPGLYAWIAGESGVVTALRRHLVRDLGMDRGQVAFMGYWRQGVAMRG
jgi:NADPH-dependent ferric siderophore reductase